MVPGGLSYWAFSVQPQDMAEKWLKWLRFLLERKRRPQVGGQVGPGPCKGWDWDWTPRAS
jgi:hypothetical protein